MPDANGSRLRVLIIDDDAVMVDLLSALFEHHGYEVSVCSSGEQALPMLQYRRRHFDVVLSDLRLPGLQGHALAAALRESRHPRTLLVGMSGSQASPSEIEMLDAFLLKPFTTEQFDQAVEHARQHRAAQSNVNTFGRPGKQAAAYGETGGREAGGQEARQVLNRSVFESLRKTLDEEQLRQVYELTLDDTQHRIDKMQASAETGDFETVRREAHTIRGSAGMVGATELQMLASATEGGAPGKTPAIADFRSACQRLQRMLDETLAH